jgi:hypothetical protein
MFEFDGPDMLDLLSTFLGWGRTTTGWELAIPGEVAAADNPGASLPDLSPEELAFSCSALMVLAPADGGRLNRRDEPIKDIATRL